MKCVWPLVKVLRLVDGDLKPIMGYVYEAIDRAKEQIQNNFNKHEKRYVQESVGCLKIINSTIGYVSSLDATFTWIQT